MKRILALILLLAICDLSAPRAKTQQGEQPITRLDRALRAAGIPIEGVSLDTRTSPPTVRIDCSTCTPQQRNQANQLAANFDLRKRRQRSLASLVSDINNLSAADRQKLQTAIAADFLQRNPSFAKTLNLNLEGDEPEQ